MNFAECIRSALDQGAIREDEAERLTRIHADELAAAAQRGEADPATAAKAAVEKIVTEEEKQALRRKMLQREKIASLADFVAKQRDEKGGGDVARIFEGVIENRNDQLIGLPSVVGRREALLGYAHGRLEQFLYDQRRRFTSGQRRNPMRLEAIVDEAFGTSSGDAKAKGFLAAWRNTADELVDAFNAAGGAMAKRKDYFPQPRDHIGRMQAAREDGFVQFILQNNIYDRLQMRDPITGSPPSPARFEEILRVSWRRKVTDGAIDRAPSMQPQGRGALANQRQDERVLIFSSADAWRQYHAAFGEGTVFDAMMDHIHVLARDVATLEVLGPNPNATVTWMRDVIKQEKGRADVGQPSLYRVKVGDTPKTKPDTMLAAMWDVASGTEGDVNKWALAVQGLRNWLTGALLSKTALTAVAGDPFQQAWVRDFAGLPAAKFFRDVTTQIFSTASRREVAQAGVIFADAMPHLRTDVGGYGLTAASHEMSKWVPDRIFMWTGLTPWTNNARRAHAQRFMFHAGDAADRTLAQLTNAGGQDAKFARWLQGFGIDEATWSTIRQATPANHGPAGGMLRPIDVIDSAPGDRTVFDAAMRYSEAIHALMEEATPAGTARARTLLGLNTRKGAIGGEIVRNTTMFLGYPTTVLMSLKYAIAHEASGGAARGMGFAFKTGLTLALGGAAIIQLQALSRGVDLRGVDDAQFWIEAFVKGGGLGFFGDWLIADYKRGGSETAARLAGPVVGFGADALSVVFPKAFFGGDEVKHGARGVEFAKRYTPVPWWIKPATDRLIFDRLQLMADPNAYRAWRRREKQLEDDTEQGTWWGRGEATPRRAPDISLW